MEIKNKRVKFKARDMGDYSQVPFSVAGNGLAVPQHELDKDGNMIKKLDKNKKQVMKNLYADIQEFKHVNDYKQMIKQNGGDLSVLEQPAQAQGYVDATQFGTLEEVLNAGAKLRAANLTVDQGIEYFQRVVAELKKQKEQKVNVPEQKQVNSEVEDDKKKK